MNLIVAIFGIALAFIGIALGYAAHPYVISRARGNPNSTLAKLIRILLLERASVELPKKSTINELLSAEKNSKYITKSVEKRGLSLGSFVNRFRSELRFEIISDPSFRIDCLKYNANQYDLLISVMYEFSSHMYFLTPATTIRHGEFALREGFFVVLSKVGTCIEFHHVARIENEISDTKYWSRAYARYFIARMLPFRYVLKKHTSDVVQICDLDIIIDQVESLKNSVCMYVVSAFDLSDAVRAQNSAIFFKIDESLSKMKYLRKECWSEDVSEKSEIVVHGELIISYSHKILFGKSSMSDAALMDEYTYLTIDHIWNKSSPQLLSSARRPKISISPSKLNRKAGQ